MPKRRTSPGQTQLSMFDGVHFDALALTPTGDYVEEVDALVAEFLTIEARAALSDADRAALLRIGARADALGYINLGTRADMLLRLEGYANA